MVDKQFFINNREQLAENIKSGFVVLHSGVVKRVSTHESYSFRPNKNFYYFTGLLDPHVVAVFKMMDEIVEPFLFIPNRDPENEKWDGQQLTIQESAKLSGIDEDHIFYLKDLPKHWIDLYNNSPDLSVWANLKDGQLNELRDHYELSLCRPQIKCIHEIVAEMRRIKTDAEVAAIYEASKIGAKGIATVIEKARPNVYEYELEAEHDYVMKSHGLKTPQYKTILGSGINTTILHYLANDRRIDEDDLILIDIDVELGAYHCDMTRTFPAKGVFSPRQREVYAAVLAVQKLLVEMVKPGITYGALNEASREFLRDACARLGLFENHQRLEEYYFHNVGHAIGLDTHDVCDFQDDDVLEAGMVLTIEPGLYITDEKIGIRIEDIVAVTPDGHRNLTEHLIKEIKDIEQLMQREEG